MHGAKSIGEIFGDLIKGSIFISSLANDRSQANRIRAASASAIESRAPLARAMITTPTIVTVNDSHGKQH